MPRLIPLLAFLVLSACATADAGRDNGILNSGQINTGAMDGQTLLNLADELYEQKNYLGAYMGYLNAVDANAGVDQSIEVNAQLGLGYSAMGLGQYDTALNIFDQLLANTHSSTKLLEGMAGAHLGLAEVDKARVIIEELDSDANHSARFYTMKGVIHDLDLQHELARQSYENALNIGENNKANITNMALSYALTGDFDTSFALLNSIEGEVRYLALVHALKGELAMAETIITQDHHRRDLGASSIERNLSFYRALAGLSPSERARAVVFGVIKID